MMIFLKVKNFSCIEKAEIKFTRLTALIGPQASGKSILSKLFYFFNDSISLGHLYTDEIQRVDKIASELSERFVKWFPPSAWGEERFHIEFTAGPISIIVRRTLRRGHRDKPIIEFSSYLEKHYEEIFVLYQDLLRNDTPKDSTDERRRHFNLQALWKIRETAEKKLQEDLKDDYIASQVFVPAGRSFFTSVGKAFAAFEHGGILDPVTIQFGRLFAHLRDTRYNFLYGGKVDKDLDAQAKQFMKAVFRGEVRFEKEKEFVETADGRIVPFSVLSSGQQELLPLVVTLEYFYTFHRSQEKIKSLIYIEEPEAHLFPSAQSMLMEYLVYIINSRGTSPNMLITTHSPYLLSKLNNLLKAGSLSRKLGKPFHDKVNSIVKRGAWLLPGSTSAYAISDRNVVPIMDSGGLIDAIYLDNASEEISKEFSSLLDLEYNHE